MKLNSDIVAGFVGSVLAHRFDDATKSPQFHLELWQAACSNSRFVAIAAPRGHAKSTAGTISYTLAEVLFRQSKFCVIVSDTEAQANMFLGTIKQELSENEHIVNLFGLKKNEKGEVDFIKDTESDIIVCFEDGHKFRIIAKGAEQKLRGLNWDGTRPDLIIIDDLENDELVMNRDRREKLRRWFYGALLPALSPKGKVRMWGTILHMDSLLERLMPKPYDTFYFQDELRTFHKWPDGKPRGWWSIKYKAHNPDFSEILWPERFNKQFFQQAMEDRAKQGMSDIYSQEYLNEPIDESVALFKKADLLPETKEDKDKRLTYYITADLAISENQRADYSVFLVAGMDEDRILHIKNVIRDRMDGREIVDTIMTLHEIYNEDAFGIEHMQVSQSIGPFLREEMQKRGKYINLVPLKHMGKDKVARSKSIQARLRAKAIKFDTEGSWYPVFEDELLKFPRGSKDDQVDAFSYLGMLLDKMTEALTDEEIEEIEYEEELNASRVRTGKSRITGY